MRSWKAQISFHPILLILCFSMMVMLVGCYGHERSGIVRGKQNVVTSFYPIAFMVEQIGGNDVNAIHLIPTGIEPHDWTPKSRDLYHATNAQLLLVNGAGFETWLDDFLEGLNADSKVKVVEVSKGISLIETSRGKRGNGSVDPHTWVSPKSALIMARNIKEALIQVDEAHRAEYEANYKRLISKLKATDKSYTDKLETVSKREIVVSHDAFSYLCRDYGLTQHAIMGITLDAEPRAQHLMKLSKLVKEKKLKYVFFPGLISDQLANTLASKAGVSILMLNPLEGLTKQQVEADDNYLTLMKRNLENLFVALQ